MGFVDSRVVAILREVGVKPYAVEAELATANSVPAAILNFIFAIPSERRQWISKEAKLVVEVRGEYRIFWRCTVLVLMG